MDLIVSGAAEARAAGVGTGAGTRAGVAVDADGWATLTSEKVEVSSVWTMAWAVRCSGECGCCASRYDVVSWLTTLKASRSAGRDDGKNSGECRAPPTSHVWAAVTHDRVVVFTSRC